MKIIKNDLKRIFNYSSPIAAEERGATTWLGIR